MGKINPSIPLVCLCGNHGTPSSYGFLSIQNVSSFTNISTADVGNTPTKASIQSYKSHFGDDYFTFWAGGVAIPLLSLSLAALPPPSKPPRARGHSMPELIISLLSLSLSLSLLPRAHGHSMLRLMANPYTDLSLFFTSLSRAHGWSLCHGLWLTHTFSLSLSALSALSLSLSWQCLEPHGIMSTLLLWPYLRTSYFLCLLSHPSCVIQSANSSLCVHTNLRCAVSYWMRRCFQIHRKQKVNTRNMCNGWSNSWPVSLKKTKVTINYYYHYILASSIHFHLYSFKLLHGYHLKYFIYIYLNMHMYI